MEEDPTEEATTRFLELLAKSRVVKEVTEVAAKSICFLDKEEFSFVRA